LVTEDQEVETPLGEGVVQLRFADHHGDVHDLNAAEMAEVLEGLVELTSALASDGEFGEGYPPEVRVRPPREGSFIIEAVLALSSAHPAEALTIATTTGGVLAKGVSVGLKRLRGVEPSDVEFLPENQVKVKWPNDSGFDIVSRKTWDRFTDMKRKTRGSLRKLMAPMGDDVDSLELRDGGVDESTSELLDSPAEVVADRRDYREAAAHEDEIEEDEFEFDVEAKLLSVDFRPDQKWTITTSYGSRKARMDDSEFVARLDDDLALHKNDIFNVTIREVRTVKNGRTSRDWSMIHVERIRQGSDDDDDTSRASAPRG